MKKIILLFTFILTLFAINNVFAGNDFIIYVNGNDGSKIYKKNTNDTSNGSAITTNAGNLYCLKYSPDGQYIYYGNGSDGNKIYKKNANDTSNGSAITTVPAYSCDLSPDGLYIIYRNGSDGDKIYKKNSNDTSDGSSITTSGIGRLDYSSDGQYIYYTNYTSYFLYKKNANDTSNGSAINNIAVDYFLDSPDGQYIYYGYNSKLYKKNANDTSNGSAITTNGTPLGQMSISFDGIYIIYSNITDGFKIYKKNTNDLLDGISINTNQSFNISYSPSSPPPNQNCIQVPIANTLTGTTFINVLKNNPGNFNLTSSITTNLKSYTLSGTDNNYRFGFGFYNFSDIDIYLSGNTVTSNSDVLQSFKTANKDSYISLSNSLIGDSGDFYFSTNLDNIKSFSLATSSSLDYDLFGRSSTNSSYTYLGKYTTYSDSNFFTKFLDNYFIDNDYSRTFVSSGSTTYSDFKIQLGGGAFTSIKLYGVKISTGGEYTYLYTEKCVTSSGTTTLGGITVSQDTLNKMIINTGSTNSGTINSSGGLNITLSGGLNNYTTSQLFGSCPSEVKNVDIGPFSLLTATIYFPNFFSGDFYKWFTTALNPTAEYIEMPYINLNPLSYAICPVSAIIYIYKDINTNYLSH